MISGTRAGGMRRGDGQSLSGWIERKALAQFVVPLIGGIGQLVSSVAVVSGYVINVTRDQAGKEICSEYRNDSLYS